MNSRKLKSSIGTGKSAMTATPPGKPLELGAAPEVAPGKLVRLHDLEGLMVISLPEELREIIGEKAFKLHVEELNQHEVVIIAGEASDLAYIRLSIFCMTGRAHGMGSPAAANSPGPTDKKSQGKAISSAKSQASSKPAVKSSTNSKARPIRGDGGNK